jgi:2-keto-4-pentenoate hydratase
MGHPANAVSWLVNKLADRDRGLKAGQVVMTGTLTPILPIEKGAGYAANFSSMGDIKIRFT